MTLSITTLGIMTLSIMTLSITTLSITTLDITTLSIMTLGIMSLFASLSIGTECNYAETFFIIRLSVVRPSVVMLNAVASSAPFYFNTHMLKSMMRLVL
jgi:hypothetical protein